jgi:hypothetical protein
VSGGTKVACVAAPGAANLAIALWQSWQTHLTHGGSRCGTVQGPTGRQQQQQQA